MTEYDSVPGPKVVGVVDDRACSTEVRINSHKHLTPGKLLAWLQVVDAAADDVFAQHRERAMALEIEPAEAVVHVAAQRGLYAVVARPGTLRRRDIVRQVLGHPAVAAAPPARECAEVPIDGFAFDVRRRGPHPDLPRRSAGPGW